MFIHRPGDTFRNMQNQMQTTTAADRAKMDSEVRLSIPFLWIYAFLWMFNISYCLAPEGRRDIGGGLSVCPSVRMLSSREKFSVKVFDVCLKHI